MLIISWKRDGVHVFHPQTSPLLFQVIFYMKLYLSTPAPCVSATNSGTPRIQVYSQCSSNRGALFTAGVWERLGGAFDVRTLENQISR